MTRRVRAAAETACACLALARTVIAFGLLGNRAVAAATRRAMEVTPTSQSVVAASGVDMMRTARAVWRAKRYWPGHPTCLQTALAMQDQLARRGLDAVLRVGIRSQSGRVAGHAWLEIGDVVLDEDRLAEEFAPFELATRSSLR